MDDMMRKEKGRTSY